MDAKIILLVEDNPDDEELVRIALQENNVVSQSVPHLHVHVVPRRRKDGLRGFFWPRTKYESDGAMAATAAAIAGSLAVR